MVDLAQEKTILLKMVIKELEQKRKVVSLSPDEISNNFEYSFENAFCKIYGSHENFNNIREYKPILIVDNIDGIEPESKKDKFIDFIWKNFDSFLLTSATKQKDINNDKIKSISGYTINGFSLKQRNSLISKICACFNFADEENIEKIKTAVSISFASCSMLDLSSPYFVLEICNKIIVDELYKQQNVSDAFSLVFINDINNRIIQFGRKENLEDYLNVLSEISFEVCLHQKSIYFDFDLISRSIKKCKEDYKNIKLSVDEFSDVFLQSGLVQRIDSSNYKISHNSILAYLASRKVCTEYKDGNYEVISNLYKNVEIGLNGDILLFVLYQLKETAVLFKIKDLLDEALQSYEEINLNKKNNPILKMKKNYGPETKKQAESKKELIDRLDSSEKKNLKEIDSKEKKALDNKNDDDVFVKTIQRAFKLIEILSKAVAGFKTELKHEKRMILTKCAISSLLKVFYAIFDVSEKDAESLHNIFEDFKEEKARIAKKDGKDDKEIKALLSDFNYENFVYDIMTTNLLNDMTYISKVMISNVSFEVIKELENEENYFCYKLFQLIAFQQSGVMQSNFLNCLEEIKKHEKNSLGNLMLSNRVVRVFAITNYLNASEFNKLSSISGINKQRLLIYKAKANSEKKLKNK